MTITDRIETLFKDGGIVSLTIGYTPKKELYLPCWAKSVATGPGETDHMQITHQVAGRGLPEMLTQLETQAAGAKGGVKKARIPPEIKLICTLALKI